ncbi:hypothetical protein ON010_g12137 [Phytophthora cinnamomi]|nr:hypothetical protein ON010_g12137 [Phytophthora cinnamomi]
MEETKAATLKEGPRREQTSPAIAEIRKLMTARRMLMAAWCGVGLLPFILQVRSYLQFVTPHKINENLVAPPGASRETANLTELCSATGFLMAQVWWNIVPTHYYNTENGRICHVVVPQYNLYGGYRIGSSRTNAPFHTTPSNCWNDSYPFEQYLYHGSFGYYSFYEEAQGSFCTKDNTAYAVVNGLGTYDINGIFLAHDSGSTTYRYSYWYGIVGGIWILYRSLVLRRSFISCNRYGQKCERIGERLHRNESVVFAYESMRLSAHGARNYHRFALLYLIVEGVMSDLFLLIAHDGINAQTQYISIGYNLSGLLLLMWEIIESTKWLSERSRMLIKRLLFSYESSLFGELMTAAIQNHLLVALNRSGLKKSNPTALDVSYYFWSFIWHTIYVVVLMTYLLVVRATISVVFVFWRNRTWETFTAPCCVDMALGPRCRMTLLDSYTWDGDKLYIEKAALRAFGIQKVVEEDGSEFLAIEKLHWLEVPRENCFIIGVVSERTVKPCAERPCMGVLGFFERSLGGDQRTESALSLFIKRRSRRSTALTSSSVVTP